ncbi:MAG: ABC transporter ATP-binding protein [Alphaproteobacteria bacterium]|nr:ABC transporter ATP-binding protein [Alphaproteobacteria bacterium]
MTRDPLLEVRDLRTTFATDQGVVAAVDGLSFSVGRGEVVGFVGESGCGKSAAALSVMRLVPGPSGRIAGGTVRFDGGDLLALAPREMDRVRGAKIAMIFQEPMTSLNPVLTVGDQIAEAARRHLSLGRRAARAHAVDMLAKVRIANPRQRFDEYPHQLSGGMRQRAMIAMAIACGPQLLFADEPTTALDVTIQAQILALLGDLQREFGMAVVLITHDMGVIAEFADRVVVMYAGRAVEEAGAAGLFARPAHPYTRGLLDSVPRVDSASSLHRLRAIPGAVPSPFALPSGCSFAPRCEFAIDSCRATVPGLESAADRHFVACLRHREIGAVLSAPPTSVIRPHGHRDTDTVIRLSGLTKHFPIRGRIPFARPSGHVRAVDGIDLSIRRGETLGLVGESGCGKSTTGWLILGLHAPTAGRVEYEGTDLSVLPARAMRAFRRKMQIVFQDPYGALDPRMTMREIVGEPLRIQGMRERVALDREVLAMLDKVGLAAEHADRYPHEFSGGQRQRIGIARALILRPSFVVCDEAVSALDVSIQAQVINLLQDLQQELELTYLFIAHDLGVVRHIADRVAVMYLGKLVELADKRELFARPLHPYTQALLASVPVPDPRVRGRRAPLGGDVPDPANPPPGCRFHTRCPMAVAACRAEEPAARDVGGGHVVACHLVGEGAGSHAVH